MCSKIPTLSWQRRYRCCGIADCKSAPADGSPGPDGLETRDTADQRSALHPRSLPPPAAPQRGPTDSAGKPAHSIRSAIHGALDRRASVWTAAACGRFSTLASGLPSPASGSSLLPPRFSLLTSDWAGRRCVGADRRPGRSPALPTAPASRRTPYAPRFTGRSIHAPAFGLRPLATAFRSSPPASGIRPPPLPPHSSLLTSAWVGRRCAGAAPGRDAARPYRQRRQAGALHTLRDSRGARSARQRLDCGRLRPLFDPRLRPSVSGFPLPTPRFSLLLG